jgi:glycosyltransferase involved in cell wall biosynthesis
MRVLMLTQELDEDNSLVNFIPRWVTALAQQIESLDVAALRVGSYTPPPNVHVYSMGKEQGRSRLGLVAGFYQATLPLVRHADAVFVHMIPRFAVMIAPLARLWGKPVTMWYTHPTVNRELRLATVLCRHVVTAAPTSFRLPTPKLRVLGHGIDTDFFAPGKGEAPLRPSIIHVGRLSAIKNHATLLRALAQGIDAQAVLIGAVPERHDPAYVDQLRSLASELRVGDRVTFMGGLPAPEVRDWYRRAAVAVNLTPAGFFDKAALESMAVGVPTVVSHGGFDDLLGAYAPQLRIDSPQDVDGLAARLRMLLAMSSDERMAIGATLRANVVAEHSLERLMLRLTEVMKS